MKKTRFICLAVLLTIAGAAVAFTGRSTLSDHTDTVSAATDCAVLKEMAYGDMSAEESENAAVCDQAEAGKQWNATYGKMTPVELAAAAVSNPL